MISGKTTHGILPIENSIGGSIHRNYDLLLEHELPVVAEVLLQVSHNLLAFPDEARRLKRCIRTPGRLSAGVLSTQRCLILATYDTEGGEVIRGTS